ncbi:MAG: hypothetical protein ACT4QC_06430 [Planctomycetaceae bacterium]
MATTQILTPTEFFDVVYGHDPLPGKLVISSFLPDTFAVWCTSIGEAARITEQWLQIRNIYFGVGLQAGQQRHPSARGGADSVIAIPGLYADVDFGKKENGKCYPETAAIAIELLRLMPLAYSLLLETGSGLHPYWLLKEPWLFSSNDDRERAARFLASWQRLLKQKAMSRGYALDSTHDLARVLRPAGTLNHNYDPPRAVRVLDYCPERLYLPEDFAPFEAPEFNSAELDGASQGSFTIPSGPVDTAALGNVLAGLLASDPLFRAIWDRTCEMGDGSPSAYTWAIGCRMHLSRATSQEIVSVSMAWRYRHGAVEPKHTTQAWWDQELKRIAAKASAGSKFKPKEATATPGAVALTNGYRLVPIGERKTPSGKIALTLKLMDGEHALVRLDVTSAGSSQKTAIKKLGKYIAAKPGQHAEGEIDAPAVDIEATLDRLLTDAQARLDQKELDDEEGPTVREIVFDEVPKTFDLRYRTLDGKVWSEAWGRAVSRQEFVTFTPASLMDSCRNASDAESSELKQLRAVQAALSVLWATLMQQLPMHAADAEGLGADSRDAKRVKAAVHRLFTRPVLSKSVTIMNGNPSETGQVRASLASLLEEEFKRYIQGKQVPERESWKYVRTAIAAYWRPARGSDGRVAQLVAMRYDLFDQLNMPCDGITDQTSLTRLGTRYGIVSDTPAVTARLTGGGRLAVLTDEMTREIFSHPTDDPAEGGFSDSEVPQ